MLDAHVPVNSGLKTDISSTLRPSGTLLFSGRPLMRCQKNLFLLPPQQNSLNDKNLKLHDAI